MEIQRQNFRTIINVKDKEGMQIEISVDYYFPYYTFLIFLKYKSNEESNDIYLFLKKVTEKKLYF